MPLEGRMYVFFPVDHEPFRVFVLQYPRRTLELAGRHRRAPPHNPLVVLRHEQILDAVDDDSRPTAARFGEVDL